MSDILDRLVQYEFPLSQYMQDEIKKTQIYLHHTAGNSNPIAVYEWWESNPERIATCIVIGGLPDEKVVQGFSSRKWAYHLGLKEQTFDSFKLPYRSLDKTSIAVEICNWGQLTLGADGKFRNYVNGVVPSEEVCTLNKPFKGFKYYHKYTKNQIENLRLLLLLWGERFNIPLGYNDDIWDVTPRALNGESGIFTHNSVRRGKNDIYPMPEMIEMLKSL